MAVVTNAAPVDLDAASGEPLHPAASEVLAAAHERGWGDPRRLHRAGRDARLLLDNAREVVAGALGVRRDEVSFTSSGTEAVHRGLLGLLEGRADGRDATLLSAVEHSAVGHAADWWARRSGVPGAVVPVDRHGRVSPDDVVDLVAPGTGVVALQAANHEVGTVQPVAEVAARLDGRVHVAGFSGSGFSARASGCGDVSFAARAPQALAGLPAGTLVVVEGGLNDWDRSDVEISTGFEDLLAAVAGHRLVVVGPAGAPSRAAYVDRVDALLADLSARHDVAYLSALDVDLDYLDDRLHLTSAGHAVFGDWVAGRLRGATRP